MKKIKLITPVIGLTTIATSIVPLTSCNNDNNFGNVTKKQWQSAWDEIWDISKDRNFTADIDIDVSGEFTNQHIDIVNKSKGQQDDIYFYCKEPRGEGKIYEFWDQIYFTQYEDVDWWIDGDYNKETKTWNFSCDPMSKSLVGNLIGGEEEFINLRILYQLFGMFYGWYNATSYDSNTKIYNCNFLDTDTIYLHFGFGFDDSTKKLNKFDINFKLTTPDGKSGAVDLTSKFECGNTQDITIPTEQLDTIKNNTIDCELNNESVTTESKQWTDSQYMVYHLTPQASPAQEFKYNTVTVNGCRLEGLSVIIDNVQLTKGIDFEYKQSGENEIITFYSEFSNKNDVKLLLDPNSNKDNVTLKISKETSI